MAPATAMNCPGAVTQEREPPMQDHRTQEGSEECIRLEQAILGLLLDLDTHRPMSEAEIARAISTPGHIPTALKRLRVAGLIHRWNDLVSAARPAVRFHQITQSQDPGSEYERRHEHAVLELLLSAAGENPMSEREIRRMLGVTKKGHKLAVIDALGRLDGAGLVDHRLSLAFASEAARRLDHVLTL